jgi:hypothetical protein
MVSILEGLQKEAETHNHRIQDMLFDLKDTTPILFL